MVASDGFTTLYNTAPYVVVVNVLPLYNNQPVDEGVNVLAIFPEALITKFKIITSPKTVPVGLLTTTVEVPVAIVLDDEVLLNEGWAKDFTCIKTNKIKSTK